MHTLRMTIVGLLVLGAFLGVAKAFGGQGFSLAKAAKLFIPIWFFAAVANMAVGMIHAGVPFLTELLVLVVVFGVPAAAAFLAARRFD